MAPLTFKVAAEPGEFEQIHRLNYRSFVEEIPQHQPSPARRLVDRFHDQNTYIIALRGERLVGMIAARGRRPFSLDSKVDNLDACLPPGRSVCEIRLLAVEPRHRGRTILRGLLRTAAAHCLDRGYDLAVISGTVRQQRLYRRLGFVPFGPVVGAGKALYQPMYLTLEALREKVPWVSRRPASAGSRRSGAGRPRAGRRTKA